MESEWSILSCSRASGYAFSAMGQSDEEWPDFPYIQGLDGEGGEVQDTRPPAALSIHS
jgi:hypothetical protein